MGCKHHCDETFECVSVAITPTVDEIPVVLRNYLYTSAVDRTDHHYMSCLKVNFSTNVYLYIFDFRGLHSDTKISKSSEGIF